MLSVWAKLESFPRFLKCCRCLLHPHTFRINDMHLHVTYAYNMYLQPSVAAEMDSLIRNRWNSIGKEFIQHNKYNPELMYKMTALGPTESVGLCRQVCTQCILHYKEENSIHMPSGNDSCHPTGHMVQWDTTQNIPTWSFLNTTASKVGWCF